MTNIWTRTNQFDGAHVFDPDTGFVHAVIPAPPDGVDEDNWRELVKTQTLNDYPELAGMTLQWWPGLDRCEEETL